MRILYGVQGTGNGHVSRCRSLAIALEKEGAKVDYIFSGRPRDRYFDMAAFGDYRTFRGVSFATRDGKISLTQTLKEIRALRLLKDVKELDLTPYDRIISDFEPVSAWAARQQNKASLGISNQASFFYLQPEGNGLIVDTIMKYYAPTTKSVGIYWFHFGQPIIPPIVDELKPTDENGQILIYLPFESFDTICSTFSAFSDQKFVCYHPDINADFTEKNIQCKKLSRENFTMELKACSGIITNAGFSLVSEALVLGKKIMVKPLMGQFEQIDNAHCLKQLGLAQVFEMDLDKTKIRRWLAKPSPEPIVYPDVAQELARWILSGEKEPIIEFSKRLWSYVKYPKDIQERIKALGWDKNSPHFRRIAP